MTIDKVEKDYGVDRLQKFVRDHVCPSCDRPVSLKYIFIEVQFTCECGLKFRDFVSAFTAANKF